MYKTVNVQLTISQRIINSVVIGFSSFFGGILLSLISPILAMQEFFVKEKLMMVADIKDLGSLPKQDGSSPLDGDEWKRDHDELYG